MVDSDTHIKKSEKAVLRTIAGEHIVVPISGHLADMEQVFALNEVGKFIWSRLDGADSIGAIAADVANEFDVEDDVACRDACDFAGGLCDRGLAERV